MPHPSVKPSDQRSLRRPVVLTGTALLLLHFGINAVLGQSAATVTTTLERMSQAAAIFLSTLDDQQRALALFPASDEERFVYRLAPLPDWGGVPLGDLRLDQALLLDSLLAASLSTDGLLKANGIMALEQYLVDLERADGRNVPVHGLSRYSAAFFGDPATAATWGWRLQGHHLSVNFLVKDGELYNAAPHFLGAQPHEVTEGPRRGWHVLGDEERLGRELYLALGETQRSAATLAGGMPRNVLSGDQRTYGLEKPEGLPFTEMNEAQKKILSRLIEETVANVPEDVRKRRQRAVDDGGLEAIHFAWAGSTETGRPMYYRVQGPEFLIEYCVTAPNHVHTIWRERNGDFGRDLLGEHLGSH